MIFIPILLIILIICMVGCFHDINNRLREIRDELRKLQQPPP